MYPRMLTTPDERSSENITTEEIQKYNQRIKETIELIPEKLTNKEKDPARESIMIVEDNKEMNDYLASISARNMILYERIMVQKPARR